MRIAIKVGLVLFFLFNGIGVFGQEEENAFIPELMLPISHTLDIRSAQFSPDGSYIVTASNDTSAKVWEVRTGKEILTLLCGYEVYSAQYSPDGSYIVTISNGGGTKIWDAVTGIEIQTFDKKSSSGLFADGIQFYNSMVVGNIK